MDIHTLIKSYESQRAAKVQQRDDQLNRIKSTIAGVNRSGRAGFTPAERDDVEAWRTRADQLKAEIVVLDTKISDAETVRDEEAEIDRLNGPEHTYRTGAKHPAFDRGWSARIGAETRTYRQDLDPHGTGFLVDVGKAALDPYGAEHERLQQHMREERVERAQYVQRAAGTGAFAGLVVPQYLTDMYAPATANMRPFANVCNQHPLPAEGMTVNISRITTATSAAVQTTENTAVSETNIDDTILTEDVKTVAGQQTLSLQAVRRGTGIEDVVIQDLFKRYASQLDNQLLNAATIGLTNVAQAVTYTDASPTAPEAWSKVMQAQAQAEAVLLGQATVSHVLLHSRRWAWFNSQTTATWPFLAGIIAPPQTFGIRTSNEYGNENRGQFTNSLIAVVDNNIATNLGAGTNEDEIYVIAADECHLWEDPQAPVFIRAEQPAAASLGVLYVIYGFFAWSFRRYTNGMQKISGTGLITPTF